MNALPPLTVAVPFAAAALLMAFPRTTPRRVVDLTALAAALTVGVMASVMLTAFPHPIVHWFGGWEPRGTSVVGIDFFADLIGSALTCFAAMAGAAALLVSWRYFEAVGSLFHALILVLLGAVAGFCLTGDLFNLFVFYELAGVSAYALTAYKIEEAGPLQGSVNFAVTLTLGASFLLAGIALLYGRTGVLNMVEMGRILAGTPPDGLVVAAFVLVAAGVLVKSAILPFHFAHADAHAVAPTPVLVIFSGILLYVGLYGLARTYWTVFAGTFAGETPALRLIFLYAGAATALAAGCMSFMQSHLKRLLAFVSISHSGLMLIGLALFDASGLAGMFVYLIAHGSVLASLFVVVGLLLHRYSEVHEHRLHGRARSLVPAGLLFTVGGLAVTGFPLFGTFVGKGLIEEAAAAAGFGWVGLVFVAASALTGGSVLRAAARVFAGWGEVPRAEKAEEEEKGQAEEPKAETEAGEEHVPHIMIWTAAALLAVSLTLGLVPYPTQAVHAAAEAFQSAAYYRDAIFEDGGAAAPQVEPVALAMRPALIKSGLAVILAAALAAANLFSARLPASLRRAGTAAGAPLRMLRSWHSGHVGDYVMWMTVGTGLFGAASLWMLVLQ